MRHTTADQVIRIKRAATTKTEGSSEPDRIDRSWDKDQPLGVYRPIRAIPAGMDSNGKKLPPSMASGSVTKLPSRLATRSLDAIDWSIIMNRNRPEPEAVIHKAATAKLAIGKSSNRWPRT